MSSNNIRQARERFDSELHTDQYRKIHSDDKHLSRLIDVMNIQSDGSYLDLGTGNGYVAFALAEKYKKIRFTGLDIAVNSIEKNLETAIERKLNNIDFTGYDGEEFPFEDSVFDGIVSRYAFHHFPDPEKSIKEIKRVLKRGGSFLLSDPLTFEDDRVGFIDRYQKLKEDGHYHFYYEKEIVQLFRKFGFNKESVFYTEVTYPRGRDKRYDELLDKVNRSVSDLYRVDVRGEEIFITVKVMNIRFLKQQG